MPTVILRNKDGALIRSVKGEPDGWRTLAPPQEPYQWKDGHSAKELAKLWFCNGATPVVPEPFVMLFNSVDEIRGLEIEEGICEAPTRIDSFRGEPRHHDQILIGDADGRRTVVGVEAKGEEEFGPIIEQHLKDPNGGARPGSKIPARIELLANSIFGKQTAEIASLRYQLLHAFAGTVIEAKKREAVRAVFMVCEFVRKDSAPDKLAQNHRDFTAFIQMFPGFESADIRAGRLFGPIRVPGGKFVSPEIPAYIGKVTIHLDE